MILIVMGVSGAGKTTLAQGLAQRLGWEFLEGDDFHPATNVEKMRRGEPLGDVDRWPWLEKIADAIRVRLDQNRPAIVTCSALKRAYRDVLMVDPSRMHLVFLTASHAALRSHVEGRAHDYMPSSLLASQLETLEPPDADETPIAVDVSVSVENSLELILRELKNRSV